MSILDAFVFQGNSFEVVVQQVDGEPVFKANDIGKIFGIQNMSVTLSKFTEDEKVTLMTTFKHEHGHTQEVQATFLTQNGVYRLMFNSRKPIAEPFRKWVYSVIKSIQKTSKYDLKKAVEEEKINIDKIVADEVAKIQEKYEGELAHQISYMKTYTSDRAVHQAIIDANKYRKLVYIAIIKRFEDGTMLIKIGSTDDIYNRCYGLNSDFGCNVSFHMVIPCDNNFALEKYLHSHRLIKPLRYTQPIKADFVSQETYHVTTDKLEQIKRIAKGNQSRFQGASERIKECELLNKRIEAYEKEILIRTMDAGANVLEVVKQRLTQDDKVELAKEINPNVIQPPRIVTQVRGDKIQRYSPDGKSLLQTYSSYMHVVRDPNIANASRSAIKRAIDERTVYKNFRWAALPRDRPDDTVQDIGDTQTDKFTNIKKGFVAMLDMKKTKVVNVFEDQKAAAEYMEFRSSANISQAIKKGSRSAGHYFVMWHDCDPELKAKYLESNELPLPRTSGKSKGVEATHVLTKEVRKFATIQHVIREFKMSRTTFNKAVEFGLPEHGYVWRLVDGSE